MNHMKCEQTSDNASINDFPQSERGGGEAGDTHR